MGDGFEREVVELSILWNLVDTLEGLCEGGKSKGCELFLFTDNLVAEYAYYNGSSYSITFFDLSCK